MTATIECPYCGWHVETVSADEVDVAARVFYGEEPGAWVKEARELRDGSTALLHHICLNPQLADVSETERKQMWWACKEPERRLDDKAMFELNCAECAQRWLQSRTN
jgi:hypothetical protein